mmetsp:Transcript_1736/g.2378  ORF Transcript_1736/g.2378 Transcript_1736/m.2378 type:complete len:128 (+) Transcript_1736:245-628(+)
MTRRSEITAAQHATDSLQLTRRARLHELEKKQSNIRMAAASEKKKKSHPNSGERVESGGWGEESGVVLKEGMRVVVRGLVIGAQLNGEVGTVRQIQPNHLSCEPRLLVLLDSGLKDLTISPKNLHCI